MHAAVLAVVGLAVAAGCLGAPHEPEPVSAPSPAPESGDGGPPLPTGRGELEWTAQWSNSTDLVLVPPEPYGPFVADASLTLAGTGQAELAAFNITTEAETILVVAVWSGPGWQLEVYHHHHGLTQDEADARAAALRNVWRATENGTRLDMHVDTADLPAASTGAQTEVYLTLRVPPEAAAALHLGAFAAPRGGLALDASLRQVCMPTLSLETLGHPLAVEYEPRCSGDVVLANAGGAIDAYLDDHGGAAYRGVAASAGGSVEVDLAGVRTEPEGGGRVAFDTPGWENSTLAVGVDADAGGGDVRLLGCAHWTCPGGD